MIAVQVRVGGGAISVCEGASKDEGGEEEAERRKQGRHPQGACRVGGEAEKDASSESTRE